MWNDFLFWRVQVEGVDELALAVLRNCEAWHNYLLRRDKVDITEENWGEHQGINQSVEILVYALSRGQGGPTMLRMTIPDGNTKGDLTQIWSIVPRNPGWKCRRAHKSVRLGLASGMGEKCEI